MITFGFIYTQFVNIFYGIYNNLLMGMTGSLEPVVPEYKNLGLNVFGAFLMRSLAEEVEFQLEQQGVRPLRTEGYNKHQAYQYCTFPLFAFHIFIFYMKQ